MYCIVFAALALFGNAQYAHAVEFNLEDFAHSGDSQHPVSATASAPTATNSATPQAPSSKPAAPVAITPAVNSINIAALNIVAGNADIPPSGSPFNPVDRASNLAMRALSLIGVNYRRGGNTPETGMDCSGFVRYVFHDVLGVTLPRRAVDISRVGEKIQQDELKPGDLVFYNTLRKTFSHVGIYLGEGRFIHSPSAGGEVRVEDMNQPYWAKHFSGARRLPDVDNAPQQ